MSQVNLVQALGLLTSIPAFLAHAGVLEKEVETDLKNPAMIAELKANSYVKAKVDALSAEWRKVEEDATAIKKSNLFTFFPKAAAFIADAGHLVSDASAATRDLSLAKMLEAMPVTKAEVAVIAAQWASVQTDLNVMLGK